MLNNKVKASLTPRADSISTVSPCVWYSMHEGAGQYVADKLGNAGDMELAAYGTGTPWANAGWLTPDGTNHFLTRSSDDYLLSLFRLDDSWAQMLFCMSIYFDGSLTNNEALFSAGGMYASSYGGITVSMTTANLINLQMRGLGSTGQADTPFTGAALTTFASQRVALIMEMLNNGDNTLDANLYFDGILKLTRTNISMVPLSASAPYGAGLSVGYRIGARCGDAGTPQDWLMNRAGSNLRMYDFIAMKRSTVSATLAPAVADEMDNFPLEFPNSLKGA